ncbi:MAG: serine protease [Alphaproteobacteria bacterium]|nr:serine protease [Alphaproteobacteria bacterium]
MAGNYNKNIPLSRGFYRGFFRPLFLFLLIRYSESAMAFSVKIPAGFWGLFAVLLLAGCGGLTVEKAPLQEPPPVPQDARPSPIGFNKIYFAVPTGTPTLSSSPKGFLGLLNCGWPYGMVQNGIRGRSFPSDQWREIFLETMEGLGYDVAGNPGLLYDEEEDEQRTIYSVGGRITDVKIDTCQRANIWGIEEGRTGEGGVTVEWTVFDLLHRKTVLRTTTKGYGTLKHPNYEGVQLLFEDALASSIHNLGADREFRDLVFFSLMPKHLPETASDAYENLVETGDPQDQILLSPSPLATVPARDRMAEITKTVVLIQTTGHGSGFFITDQGHILTNAHVVGNADRVRVVTSTKKDKLIARVLRVDKKRDVALLKLDDMPGDLHPQILPIRADKPDVGQEVYAVGAPARTRLQDTVTKGIVSAHRYDPRKKQWEIQADVFVYAGNSGGPLIDEFGNVVGLTVSGWKDQEQALSGLNNFIPIKDALEALDIEFESGAPIPLK